jgi:uncharacterized damage-inducible protein DinB
LTILSFLNWAYEYHWANARILSAAANAGEAQFNARVLPKHNSLRGTLVHLERGMDLAFSLAGHIAQRRFCARTISTLDSIRDRWHQEEQAVRPSVVQNDDSLQRSLNYTNLKGTPFTSVVEMMLHVVNHGTPAPQRGRRHAH